MPNSLENFLLDPKLPLPPSGKFIGFDPLSQSILLAATAERDKRPLLVVSALKADARNLVDNLSFFLGGRFADRIHYFPNVEFDYFRGLLPNPDVLMERNVALFHALNDPAGRIFVTTVGAVIQQTVPASEFLRATLVLKKGAEILRENLVGSLLEAGYQSQPTAYDPGTFAVRGGVVDIFSPLYAYPLRLEFYGDFIDEIRFYDPKSQRSLEASDQVYVIPVTQVLVPPAQAFEAAAIRVKERFDHLGILKGNRDEIVEKIRQRQLSQDLGYLFPLLSGGVQNFLDYLPEDAIRFWDGKEKIWEIAETRDYPHYAKSFDMFEKELFPIAEKEDLFLAPGVLKDLLDRRENHFFEDFGQFAADIDFTVKSDRVLLRPENEAIKKGAHQALLASFADRFKEWMDLGYRVQIISHTRTHAERIALLFGPYGLKTFLPDEKSDDLPALPRMLATDFSELTAWQGFVSESRIFPELKLVILGEEEIFGHKKRAPKSAAWTTATDPNRVLSSFRDLKVDDFIVHREHGIGKYLGLRSMNFLGVPNDYVLLEYKDGDKLYIPVYRLNVLQKYVGGEGAAPILDKLGGDRWIKAKQKAERAIAELAAELLKIQARRKLIPAYAFSEPNPDFRQFEMEFPFDETPDQLKSIDDVMRDLSEPHPMDRLLCGDVGYGKTEVAMRSACRAVLEGKQVGVLVPTTVLAFQHFETFKQRFKNLPVRVEMVSRLRTSAEVKSILEDVKTGKVDIVIGTHRLLSPDVQFSRLALVIIDEEHRFGVAHKEKLKKMTESTHVLSMTATPIPRTLNMAMAGIKDISLITTPPPDRLSVRTFVCRRSEDVMVEAIANEISRDGQVYFVHNRVETIFKVGDELRQLFPKLKIEVVHGQMDPSVLEQKMLSFYQSEFHVLVTTTIIESGLDIPRANTIIIDRADCFGLAQLYQLRGRVGRSDRRAYCYLMIPGETAITPDAKERLQVIQRYTDLGSGFQVASHDLEIRGAGDLLGKDQSGHLNAVGIDMYFELLEESIAALKGQRKKIEIEPEITMKVAAYFPQDYLPDISERIQFYRRLSSVEFEEQISEIETEIRDRFGPPPREVIHLLGLMKIKLYLKKLHVLKMACGPKKTSLHFAPTTPARPELLVQLIKKNPKKYAMSPDQKLVFSVGQDADWQVFLNEVQELGLALGVEV